MAKRTIEEEQLRQLKMISAQMGDPGAGCLLIFVKLLWPVILLSLLAALVGIGIEICK